MKKSTVLAIISLAVLFYIACVVRVPNGYIGIYQNTATATSEAFQPGFHLVSPARKFHMKYYPAPGLPRPPRAQAPEHQVQAMMPAS